MALPRKWLLYKGEWKTVAEVAAETGLGETTIRNRIARGMTMEEAVKAASHPSPGSKYERHKAPPASPAQDPPRRRPSDKVCRKCRWHGALGGYIICDYCYTTGHTRGCPPGEGCARFTPRGKTSEFQKED